jgi:hypothetical protein
MPTDWQKPEVIVAVVGIVAGLIGALIGAFVTLRISRKQMEQQAKQAEQEQVRAHRESEAMHRQRVQAFVDYLYDVRSLNKPPQPSGVKLWGAAYKRLHEVRRRLTETLSLLPSDHIARDYLVRLLDAFHAWSDEWDKYGDFADTHGGQRYLMEALQDLQNARVTAEDELRRVMNLPKPESKAPPNDDLVQQPVAQGEVPEVEDKQTDPEK